MPYDLHELADRITHLNADVQLHHASQLPPIPWWGKRVALLDELLAVLNEIYVDPRLDDLHRAATCSARTSTEHNLRGADLEFHARIRDARLSGPSPRRPFELHHSCPNSPTVDPSCGTFPTLQAAQSAAGHSDPRDWVAAPDAPDFLYLASDRHLPRPGGSPWVIHAPSVALLADLDSYPRA